MQPGCYFLLFNQNCSPLFFSSVFTSCFWLFNCLAVALIFSSFPASSLDSILHFFIILSVALASFYFPTWFLLPESTSFSLTGQPQASSIFFHCLFKENSACTLNAFVPSPYVLHLSLQSDRQLIVNQCHSSQLSHLLQIDLQISKSAPVLKQTALDG